MKATLTLIYIVLGTAMAASLTGCGGAEDAPRTSAQGLPTTKAAPPLSMPADPNSTNLPAGIATPTPFGTPASP